MTGGRIKRIKDYLEDDDFCLTYGDGLSDVDINALVAFHRQQKTLATVTAVQPPGRFGVLNFDGHRITKFQEKPDGDGGWINGGFFVLSPRVIDYIEGDETIWEQRPLEGLARDQQLSSYRHHGFWQPMDTLRDKMLLKQLWSKGNAPWKVWQ